MRVHGPKRPFLALEREHPAPKTPYVDFKAVKQAASIVQILDHCQPADQFNLSFIV